MSEKDQQEAKAEKSICSVDNCEACVITISKGVSSWKNHGKKYGYWEYFEKQIIASERQRILDALPKEKPYGKYETSDASFNQALSEIRAILTKD